MTPPDPPVFAEPWQAQVFALAVTLNERGLFGWSEWTAAFGAELQAHADYFEAWLRTLEKLTVAKGFAREGELEALAEAWMAAAEATPHGKPIVLGAERDET